MKHYLSKIFGSFAIAVLFAATILPVRAHATTYGPFMISNNATQLCMTAHNNYANGSIIDQQNCNGNFLSQHWIYVDTGVYNQDGYPTLSIRPYHSQGKCVSIEGGSNSNGAHAVLATCAVAANQYFAIYVPNIFNVHVMRAMHSSQYLQVNGGPGAGPGALITQWVGSNPCCASHFYWAASVY